MLPRPLPGHNVGVHDYSSRHRPAHRVHSTFISELFIKTHKLEVTSKTWDSTTETGKVPAGETGAWDLNN
jgi:hypothetical protein